MTISKNIGYVSARFPETSHPDHLKFCQHQTVQGIARPSHDLGDRP
jgi:hypothetical protein